jgi:DNA mismatch repair ATPase MutL
LINIQQHVKFGAITAVLLLFTVMLTTIDGSQKSVLAQTSTLLPSNLPPQDSTSTPTTQAAEPSGSNDLSTDESSGSSESVDNNDMQDTSSTTSEGQNSAPITPASETSDEDSSSSSSNDGNDESSGSSGSDGDDSDSQNTSSSDDDSGAEEETDDSEQTNPLLQQIRNSVSTTLSAIGMVVP